MEPTSSSAIIVNDKNDTVFAAKSSLTKKLSPGLWETIGGAIEPGEIPEECVTREIKEELGVEVATLKPFKDKIQNLDFALDCKRRLSDYFESV